MRTKQYLYLFYFLITLSINTLIILFIPPTWIACDCFYNNLKTYGYEFLPLLLAITTLVYINRKTKRKESGIKLFLLLLLISVLISLTYSLTIYFLYV